MNAKKLTNKKAVCSSRIVSPFPSNNRMSMKDKFKLMGRKLVVLAKELKAKGRSLYRKSRDGSIRIGAELMERGTEVLRRTPGIKEVKNKLEIHSVSTITCL